LLSTLTQPNLTNGESNIFLRNTCLGATSSSCSTPTTSLVSTAANGGAADGPSSEPSIDSGGTNVAFTSTASNLVNYVAVSGGTRQVYWQTPCTGTASSCTATNAPVLVSLSADETSAGNGDSYNPMISPDGQYVAFVSLATNLVSGLTVDGVTPQVYIRTICAGVTPLTQSPACVPTTFLVSSPDGVTPANGASSHPAIANTGLFVSFVSTATNLGATAPNPSAAQEVFETSTCVTGVSGCTEVTTLISSPDGVTAANGASVEPAISADGRFIAFASTATNLVIGVGPTQQIYVRDTCNEVSTLITSCTPSTNLVSSPDTTTTPATPANSLSENPSLSECGTSTSTSTCQVGLLIAFATKATNLSSSVQNGVENIFVRSTCQDLATTTTACTPRTVLASQPAGTSATASNGDNIVPAISGDGHTVAFISSATNLVTNDTNGFADVFLGVTSF
jgi:Tol biopolymer transport system component